MADHSHLPLVQAIKGSLVILLFPNLYHENNFLQNYIKLMKEERKSERCKSDIKIFCDGDIDGGNDCVILLGQEHFWIKKWTDRSHYGRLAYLCWEFLQDYI